MIPAVALAFLGKHRDTLIKLGIVAVMLGAAWIHGCSTGADMKEKEYAAAVSAARAERIAYYEGEIKKAREDNRIAQADTRELGERIDKIQGLQTTLLGAIDRANVTIRGIDRETGCPVPRLGPAFRVCWNAAVTGSPGAAADCGAFGVPGLGSP